MTLTIKCSFRTLEMEDIKVDIAQSNVVDKLRKECSAETFVFPSRFPISPGILTSLECEKDLNYGDRWSLGS